MNQFDCRTSLLSDALSLDLVTRLPMKLQSFNRRNSKKLEFSTLITDYLISLLLTSLSLSVLSNNYPFIKNRSFFRNGLQRYALFWIVQIFL